MRRPHIPLPVRRKAAVVGASVALGLAGAVAVPTTAHATPVDITCLTGNRTTHYTPPLTNTPRPTHLSLDENFSCVSLLGGVSSGTSTSSRDVTTSCLLSLQTPLNIPARTITYHWNTGDHTTVTYPAVTAVRAADGTVTIISIGAVTDGLGEGQVATQTTVEPNLNLTACATTGLSATNSLVNTLVITPV
ncbi:hypothetical protein ACGF5T_32080 [Streptomyces sp. NPDC047853]|uniref:hypothetical protein n=1 Tax=unclassified Streptomyces TaxID=2593676 RepID=UPI00345244E4